MATKVATKKKVRRSVSRAVAHINASFNNTYITITDLNGDVLCWSSSGTAKFSGSKKSTPFAATRAAEDVGNKARKFGVVELEVQVKGLGAGRESAISGLQSTGLRVISIEDRTPLPHNGCRPAKRRRV